MTFTASPLTSSEIAHDVFALGAMAVPVLFFMHHHPLIGLAIAGFEAALFYSLGGPRIVL